MSVPLSASIHFKPCIIIPLYNHAAAIGLTIDELAFLNLPCIIVNDASTDSGAAVIDAIAQKYNWVITHHRSVNGGKGAAVKDAVRIALEHGFTHALQLDADGQHDIQKAPEFLKNAKDTPNAFVVGYPIFDSTAPRARVWGRELSNILCWLETCSLRLRDVLCGFRVYPIHLCGQVILTKTRSDRMDFDPEVATKLCWMGLPVINVATRVSYPRDGISHFHMLSDNLLIVRMHFLIIFDRLLSLFSIKAYS